MSLRIHFHSSEFPESIAKSLRRHLNRLGHTVGLGRMREATAVMYGYDKWNDLLGRIGQASPFLSDQELDPAVAAERASVFTDRLSRALDLPADVAAKVVTAAGPTSRRSMGGTAFNWEEAVLRMAGAIAANARSIEPQAVGAFEGFRVNAGGRRRDWALAVDAAGTAIYSVDRGNRFGMELDEDPEDGMFGRHLQNAGLLKAGVAGEPNPLVLRTLRRLDGRALRMLRAVPVFGTEVYDIARMVPEGAAFEGLVDRLPMLGAEISNLAHDILLDSELPRDHEVSAQRKAMVLSSDPIAGYLNIVEDFAATTWPHLTFDRRLCREVVEAIGNVLVLEDKGLMPWHVAFMSFAPTTKLPTLPSQMGASMRFIDKWFTLFSPQIGIDPANFYKEFDGDWAKLRSTSEGMEELEFFSDLNGVAQAVTDALLGDRPGAVADLEALPGHIALGILERRLTPRLSAGRGMMGLMRPYARWSKIRSDLDREDVATETYGDGVFKALTYSGLLPADLASLTPQALLKSLSINPSAYAEALFDTAELSESEIEIRITTASVREAVVASLLTEHPTEEAIGGSTMFHRAEIGGIVLEAHLSAEGPCIRAIYGPHNFKGVALGACARVADLPKDNDGPAGAYVTKFGRDKRIDLKGFGPNEFALLWAEFGIGTGMSSGRDFYQSEAARSLIDYVKSHPRIAKRMAETPSYVGDWYGWAVENAPGAGSGPNFH